MVKDEKIRQMGVKEGQPLRTGTGGRRRRLGLDWSHVAQPRLQVLSGLCLLWGGGREDGATTDKQQVPGRLRLRTQVKPPGLAFTLRRSNSA